MSSAARKPSRRRAGGGWCRFNVAADVRRRMGSFVTRITRIVANSNALAWMRSLKQRRRFLNKSLGFFNVVSDIAIGTIEVILVIVIVLRLLARRLLDDGR